MSWTSLNHFHQDLDGRKYLEDFAIFNSQVLKELIAAVRTFSKGQTETFSYLSQDEISINWFVHFLRGYLHTDDFRKVLYSWYRGAHQPEEKKRTPYRLISTTWKERLDELNQLDKDLDDANREQITAEIEKIAKIIEEILQLPLRDPGETDPYEEEVLALLNQQIEPIFTSVTKLHAALKALPEIKLENEAELLTKFAQKWIEENPEITDDAIQQAQKIAKDALQELIGTSQKGKQKEVEEAWQKLAEEFTDDHSDHPKVAELQQSRELSGLAFGSGLLSVALRKDEDSLKESPLDPDKHESTPLLWVIYQQILFISTYEAANDVTRVVEAFIKAIDKLLEFLEEEKKKRLKTAQEEISAAFLPIPGAAGADDAGGGAETTDDDTIDTANLDTGLQALFNAWKKTLDVIAGLGQLQRDSLPLILQKYDVSLEDFSSKLALLTFLQERYTPGNPDLLAINISKADACFEELNDFLQSLSPEEATSPEEAPKATPEETTPAKDDTEFAAVVPALPISTSEDALLTEEKTQSAAHNITRVARAKFELLEMVNKSLYEELDILRTETGVNLSDTELQSFIHRQQGDLSQDVWLRLLENGALSDKVDSTRIRKLWGDLADEYLRRIIVDIPTLGKPFVEAAMANSKLFGGEGQRFYKEWQEKQRAKERIAEADDKGQLDQIAASLQPAAVEAAFRQSQALTINPDALRQYIQSERERFYGGNAPSDPSLNAFLSQILQSAETIRQSNDPETISRAFEAILAELNLADIGALQDAVNRGDLQAQARIQAQSSTHLWKTIFFDNPVLYAYFFALPEMAVAGEYLQNIRTRWVEAFNENTALNSKHLQIAAFWKDTTAVAKPGQATTSGYHEYDAKLPEQRQIDLAFALNLLYMSDLEGPMQMEVETAIYSYFVLNQRQGIQLQQVIYLINNAKTELDIQQNEKAAIASLHEKKDYGQSYLSSDGGYAARQAMSVEQGKNGISSAEKMQALMGAVKVAGLAASGNWIGAAKEILTNKALQKQAKALIQKLIIANILSVLLPLLAILAIIIAVIKFLAQIVNFIIDVVTFPFHAGVALGKAVGGAIKGTWNLGSNFVQGAWKLGSNFVGEILGTGEAGEAAASMATTVNNEAAALTKGAVTGAENFSYNAAVTASYVAGQAGTAALLMKITGIALLVAMLLPAILTIIVFTVIGGSLNDLPAGFSLSGTKHSYCYEGDDRIANAAIAMSSRLQPGFWDYYNKHPDFPQHWRQDVFETYGPDPVYPGPIQGFPDAMFWCAWLVTYVYEANGYPVAHTAAVAGHRNAWESKTGNPVRAIADVPADGLPIGGAIFLGTADSGTLGEGTSHIALLCAVDVDSAGNGTITTCDSNNFARQVDYDVVDNYVVQYQGGVSVDFLGPPPNSGGGSCDEPADEVATDDAQSSSESGE